MDLRDARAFIAVVDLGSMSKAAVNLRVAQPALSRRLADFEHELGFKLFDRIGRKLLLTSEGEQLVPACRMLLSSGESVRERAHSLRKANSGVLRVAASPQHIESVFAGLLPRYAREFPEVQVEIREGSGREMLRMLEQGEIHFAQNLLYNLQPDPDRFMVQRLAFVDLLVACHPRTVLGRQENVDVSVLKTQPLLLLDTGFGFRRAFDAACRMANIQPRIRFESRSPNTLLALAEANLGVAVIPSALRTDRYKLKLHGLSYRSKLLRQELTVLYDKRRLMPAYATAFRKLWLEHASEVLPISRPGPTSYGRKP